MDYERETYSSLDEACNINHKSLWAKHRSKKKINSIISINVDNNTITNPKTICNAMADHFSKVFSDRTEDHFDEKFKSYVDERVSEFKKKAMTSDEEFNIPASLVKTICSNVPNNKTCGLTVYSTNILNMVAHISSFAWHASSRLLLTKTVSLVNGIMVFLFLYLRVIINLG